MTTLYIRYPARLEGEAAACGFALTGDDGGILQQGAGALRGLSELIAQARRTVLLLPASTVTLLHMKVPPLPAAKLKAALPGLVEDHILADPLDCALVAGPAQADGMRTIAVVQRAWLEAVVKALLALGARSISAVPMQLCLPTQPGEASALIEPEELVLRTGQYEGLGLALADTPANALASARAFAGDVPLTVYAPAGLLSDLGPAPEGVRIEEMQWPHLINGSKSTTLDLVPALGSAGVQPRDWQRWRWPLRLAVAALVVNLFGLNMEWLRMKREAAAVQQSMNQTFKAVYPNETILDPVAQMRKNLEAAKASTGQVGRTEFTYLAAALGDASALLPRRPVAASMQYREGALIFKARPDSTDANTVKVLRSALEVHGISLEETAPNIWELRGKGGV